MGSGSPETRTESTPQPTTPKVETTSKQKTPDQLKDEAAKKKETGEKSVKEKTRGKLDSMLGGDFGLLMKKLFDSFGGFLSSFDGIRDKIGNVFAAQSPEEVDRIFKKSKDYKVPKIDKPEGKSTNILNPNKEEKLLSYLYRCLGIPEPTKEQVAPKKKLDIRHLISQLWRTYPFEKGKKAILKGFTDKPPKFFKDDIVFFRNALNGEITAGFVQEIGEYKVKVTTLDETGTKRTVGMYKNMCLMAFQIPGNKTKGAVPVKKKKKKVFKFGETDEDKKEKKPDQKVDQSK